MEFNHISDVTLRLVDKIDNQWKLFFASNLGIAVWIYSDSNSIDVYFTVIASIAYMAYSFVCCFSAIRAYKFLEFAMAELKLSINDDTILSDELRKAIFGLSYKSRIYILVISYLIAIPVILFLFWSRL